jgi:hypothetical protein
MDANAAPIKMSTSTPSPCCATCHHRMADAVCWMQKRQVEDGHVCMAFSRKMEQEPIQAAPLPAPEAEPTVESLPPAPLVESLPVLTVEISDPPRPIRHRQPFNFAGWLRQVLKINRIGRLNFHFPAQLHGDEVNTNQEQERKTP